MNNELIPPSFSEIRIIKTNDFVFTAQVLKNRNGIAYALSGATAAWIKRGYDTKKPHWRALI